jgi:hypothetical protein
MGRSEALIIALAATTTVGASCGRNEAVHTLEVSSVNVLDQ